MVITEVPLHWHSALNQFLIALRDFYELLGTLTWYSLYELHGTFPTRLALLEARKTRKEMTETCLRKFSNRYYYIQGEMYCFCITMSYLHVSLGGVDGVHDSADDGTQTGSANKISQQFCLDKVLGQCFPQHLATGEENDVAGTITKQYC